MEITEGRSYGPYVSVPDRLLRDRDLSIRAKGLYAVLAAMHAHGETVTARTVVDSSKEGTAAVRAAMTELEKGGWITRARERDGRGRVAGITWTLLASPDGRYTPPGGWS